MFQTEQIGRGLVGDDEHDKRVATRQRLVLFPRETSTHMTMAEKLLYGKRALLPNLSQALLQALKL